jgi:hypothetical protein
MNSVFSDNTSQSQEGKNTVDSLQQSTHMVIDHTTPGVYVYNPLGYSSSFKRVPNLVPAVGETLVTTPTKKRKSVSTQTEFNFFPKVSDKEDEDFDLYFHGNSNKIFEDFDMDKQLKEMTALSVQKPVWVNGSEFWHLQGSHKVDPESMDMYSSSRYWGTDKSTFAHSISQLY